MVAWAIDIAPIADRLAQTLSDGLRAKMPSLRILADEQNELQVGEKREESFAPQFGAFAARRQVAALGVVTRETEPHRHDRYRLRIVEDLFADAEPAA